MLPIKVTYRGRNYENVADAAEKLIMNKMIDQVRTKLKPFEEEILAVNGEIALDFKEGYDMDMKILKVPDDLKRKIQELT